MPATGISTGQAAKAIGVKRETLRRWRARGGLPKAMSIPHIVALRCAALAVRHAFPALDAVELCLKLATPAAERLLSGQERKAKLEVWLELEDRKLVIDLGRVLSGVLQALGPGFAPRIPDDERRRTLH